ncbi:MAG: hypothetical protein AAFU53_11885 [Cyanobacteria bacterium J06632_3]
MSLLFLAGGAVSATAQTKISVSTASSGLSFEEPLSESTQLEADIQRIVDEVMAAETAHWSPAQKAALKEMEAMGLKDSELEAIASLTVTEMSTQLKSDKKLSKLSATGISSEEALKLAPALLLSRYLLNIGRAALWGGVVSAIRSADFDYRAMTSALTSGNTREFMSLLRDGLATDQTRFTNMVSTAADFACASATLDVNPRLCDRFATGLQKIFTRINHSNTRSTRNRALSLPLSNKTASKKVSQSISEP